MKILGRMAVFPEIPERIQRLRELAYNLWWTWNPPAQRLFATISPEIWQSSEHSAVRVLLEVDAGRLAALASDGEFVARYDAVCADFDAYMHPAATWFSQTFADEANHTIAYFSAEFGLHESLPIYSGGLGILSGDHCKEASDLGLPFIGVGFLYPQGYFRQRVTAKGQQEAIYEKMNFSQVAAQPAMDSDGHEVMISVDLPGRKVYAKVWRIQVGRIPLYLMDTDVEPNVPGDRVLSARLYGGDHEMRIAQEIMLGIGGVRALRALGLDPMVWHMNEGHAAFLELERCREMVQGMDVSFDVAREIAAANAIFTTHTPVAAGNDAFNYELADKYFADFWPQLGLDRDQFHDLAREETSWGSVFSMTVLALRLSTLRNGVSRLHGDVSRRMWQFLWPELEVEETPITSITNGVHTATWVAPTMDALYQRYLAEDWYAHLDDPNLWEHVREIPDEELWGAHNQLKEELLGYARARLARQRERLGEGPMAVRETHALLNPAALTIGFARRFATYKRATLIFRDPERLARLLNNPDRPVQLIFAGKAHPNDKPGQDFICQVYEFSRQPEFHGKIVFLEDYDMDMARHLVSGCDIWLNNPVRPHEASGTSGQKASLNGLPNLSILDGWWEEGYNGRNGWAFGERRDYQDDDTRDEADVLALYAALENQIVPIFFDRGSDDLPHAWLSVMREAIRTVAPAFSMRRMVKEYTEKLYVPALVYGRQIDAKQYALARALADWKRTVRAAWPKVSIRAEGPQEGRLAFGDPVQVEACVQLGALRPDDVRVELVAARDDNGNLRARQITVMEPSGQTPEGERCYTARLLPPINGSLVYGVRVVPSCGGLSNPLELGLARWA
ncbi:MAG TPA: alpha-glucan family phosphorylase [Ktedonobacterales bacterium]|nr:alpha-glucan family phosphorylase [Ktedonobacterales bacterium]